MALAFLTLLTGLAISAVAIYYSVIGLAAIFSAAVIPIIVMGAILEVSKLVSAWWLKANWHRAPFLLKSYMLVAVMVLMLITSMGIFGFLSKAHTDQAIMSGDVSSQVALFDEQIKIERENIENAKSLISQMDATVQGIIANGESREIKLRDGRTYQRSAAEQALQVRRSQAKDRAALTKTIEEAQANILELQKKKAPIAAEQRKVEAEVGPIKYIAKLIYGDNSDQNLLEKAVTWVIITIVFVFDPLAVLLLLASQMSFQWARQEKERKNELVQEETPPENTGEETPTPSQPDVETVDEGSRGQSQPDTGLPSRDDVEEEANRRNAEIEPEFVEPEIPEEYETVKEEIIDEDDDLFDDDDTEAVREAKKNWKHDHPNDSLKRHKRLLQKGLITELPWEKYLKVKPDYQDDADAEEAAKWAMEQLEKKQVSWIEREEGEQIKKTQDYVQNAEQNDSTLWQRVKKAKDE